MKRLTLLLSGVLTLAVITARSQTSPKFDRSRYTVPVEKFVLKNGLTLLVSEEHSAPVVSVNMWYHVGSRNETRGKTGFAHLFEHFFFNGSEHYPHGFREAMDDVGANNRNGTTNSDRTNFFEDVPVSALERTLYLEADRMGYLKLSKERLERERGVVQNEKRQGLNQPMGKAFELYPEKLYPYQHPYSWTTIGSMADLNAATPEDVKEWYQSYYGPNNAVIALSGDITGAKALELVKKYFEGIAPVPPLERLTRWIPTLENDIRDKMEDRIPETVILRFYHLPEWRAKDLQYCRLLAGVLSGSKSARLNKRMIYEKQLATSIDVSVDDSELSSLLLLSVTVKNGVDPAAAEKEMDAIIDELVAKGPTDAELTRAKNRYLAAFSRNIERTGGFAGRSDILAMSMTYGDSPAAYLDQLEILANATPADVKNVAATWLTKHHYTLVVNPYADAGLGKDPTDRSALPALGGPPDVSFPALQRATLKNGLKVILLERNSVPSVNVTLAVNAGYSSDLPSKAGVATLALELIDKGTTTKDLFAISDQLDAVGAQLITRTTMDVSVVQLKSLAQNLTPSMEILADVVLNPSFPEAQFEIAKTKQLADIDFEKSDPQGMAGNVLPALIFGKDHPYGMPESGLGNHQAVSSITRKDLTDWHAKWFNPSTTTVIVTGNVKMLDLLPALEKTIGGWKGNRNVSKNIPTVAATKGGKVYIIDKPEAAQSVIVAAHLVGPADQTQEVAIETFMRNFGGMSTSRLNRNLRLDKHWSYGASGFVIPSKAQRAFEIYAPVQTDKTKEAMMEISKEIKDLAGQRPLKGEEYSSIMRNMSLRLPARFSTLQSLESAAFSVVSNKLPDDYWQTYAAKVRALTEDQLNTAAKNLIHPSEIIWLIVGDRKKIETGVKELSLGEVIFLDAEGNVVK